MGEYRRTTYRISEAARDLGISAEWLRGRPHTPVPDVQGFMPGSLELLSADRRKSVEDRVVVRRLRASLFYPFHRRGSQTHPAF
jgi:hypothetical protein